MSGNLEQCLKLRENVVDLNKRGSGSCTINQRF